MTTIFISKMESLPHTSDIKMIDFWLVFCQMIPFAEVVLLTAMEYHRNEESVALTNSGCVQVTPINLKGTEFESKKWHERINMSILTPKLTTLGKVLKINIDINFNKILAVNTAQLVSLPEVIFVTQLVDVVTADEDSVGNNLLQIWKLRFGQKAKLWSRF